MAFEQRARLFLFLPCVHPNNRRKQCEAQSFLGSRIMKSY